MNKPVITKSSAVAMHYTLRLEDDSVADSSLDDNKPGVFTMGSHHISEAFENHLLGMAIGDKKRICLAPQEAFGMPLQENMYTIPENRFRKIEDLSEGMIVNFAHPEQGEMPGVIRRVMNGLVFVDFNHPLAGKSVIFDVEIVDIADSEDQIKPRR